MSSTRSRRIVRHAVMALAGIVLLLSGYVSSFVAIHLTSPSNFKDVAVNSWFYKPLLTYMFSNHAGHLEFRALCTWCMNRFHRPLIEYYESERMREREGGDLFERDRALRSKPGSDTSPQGQAST